VVSKAKVRGHKGKTTLYLTGYTIAELVRELMYYTSAIKDIPQLIANLA
jgi:hypothetical protein